MNLYGLVFVLASICASFNTLAASTVSILYFGTNGTNYAREWINTDGRVGMQALGNNASTALDLWPTSGTLPSLNSLSEITLQRKLWGGTGLERFNMSAMVDSSLGGSYRFGVERAGTGKFRNIVFCFEDVAPDYVPGPGGCICQMKITPEGVYVTDDKGATWRRL